jgi:proline iminopeptidase
MKLHLFIGGLLGALSLLALNAQADEDIPRTSGVLTVRGDLHTYLTEGRDEPCIVVGFAPQYPTLFSARLKQHIRLIYVDYKNSWDATDDRSVQATTMDSLIAELDDVRKGLGLERVCLLGHSTPGLVAIEYAARHPEHTSRVILVGVTPFYNRELIDTWSSFWEADASPERKAALAENIKHLPDSTLSKLSARDAFALRYARTGPRLFFDPKYDFYWAWIGHQFSAPMLDRFWKVIVADYDPWSRLSKNTVPMLVVLGRYDYAVPYRLWDRVKASTPGLTSVMLERSAHFPMIEEPQRFDEALVRWLPRN